MARAVPCTRTYRPVPETVRSSTPPSPLPVEWTSVHTTPSADVCTWYALACAVSQCRRTRLTECVEPRSIRIHSGSRPSTEAQRVDVLPSTALPASSPAASTEEAVTALPRETSGSAAVALVVPVARSPSTSVPNSHFLAMNHLMPIG
ncbi:hypothetical protein SAMN05421507_10251 [Lentzea jiangxiensis]|uniref:Uncharacterized protein n=1 Tax=Lentzea jiangxiensis TaxID=641025 RepID=A0A1H0ICL5_9PSEU|nr:hypothetical protein [Lentzea jiangxiensis]SDO29177.1 hypothetical protein SAMN05421507_10251 [Lentzea jiangxiensis]